MKIRFHEKLYRDKISDFQVAAIHRKIKRRSPKLNLFLITLPIGNQGILEIYWYPELLQSVYQNMDAELVVVGLAHSRESAFRLIEQILEEAGFAEGNNSIRNFFEEST